MHNACMIRLEYRRNMLSVFCTPRGIPTFSLFPPDLRRANWSKPLYGNPCQVKRLGQFVAPNFCATEGAGFPAPHVFLMMPRSAASPLGFSLSPECQDRARRSRHETANSSEQRRPDTAGLGKLITGRLTVQDHST